MENIEKQISSLNNIKKTFRIVGYSVLVVTIILFVVTFFGHKARMAETLNWKKTECTVVRRIVVSSSGSGNRNRRRGRSHYWQIKFQYEFDGYEYTSNKYSLLARGPYMGYSSEFDTKFKEEVEKTVEENSGPYPEGSKNKCYVNPNDPKEALLVLEKPTYLNTFGFLLLNSWKLWALAIMFLAGIILRSCGIDKAPNPYE